MKSAVRGTLVAFAFMLTMGFAVDNASAQPAPALTRMRVLKVYSPLYKNGLEPEDVSDNRVSTANNHGGNWLIVVVEETGYGRSQFATMSGTSMRLVASKPIENASRRITGYIRTYRVDMRFNEGRFTCTASSINFPWGTQTASIYIR
jgi:hypothetical protein